MAKKKTPQETPPVTMRKPRTGKGLLQVGNPGNKGGTGRPPDEFKRMCQALATSDEVLREAVRVLDALAIAVMRAARQFPDINAEVRDRILAEREK